MCDMNDLIEICIKEVDTMCMRMKMIKLTEHSISFSLVVVFSFFCFFLAVSFAHP